MFGPLFMGNDGCECCVQAINTCGEFDAWLATKTDLQVTIAAEHYGGIGFPDCTDAVCEAAIGGTYILTKIAGGFPPGGSCVSEPSGHTFAYTFSTTIGCVTSDDPYTGIAVDFYCDGSEVRMRLLYRHAGGSVGCATAYFHNFGSGIPLGSPLSAFESGVIPTGTPGAFSDPCVPTSADAPFMFL